MMMSDLECVASGPPKDLGMGTGVGETRFVWREKNDFQKESGADTNHRPDPVGCTQ
ncbi:uncharacterized protein ANIA_11316 [Aspergillus nidulans FGSC A4]|uniref:Uncharacterized protein n=1 Tax=Emericella nidulans (strain FGSC A4 / ATCC 38163 / CBS 112.46 / NRRL 194 / M139) TaxID=227321 RepID=C8VPQ2_EMENI|nr:hypothetical protein [Aspergillus nidulans FGSC A4]CBF85664.1 TPA: hypothetical protein ANIA_11316 [Aspergillus nidulans FGSC A4]